MADRKRSNGTRQGGSAGEDATTRAARRDLARSEQEGGLTATPQLRARSGSVRAHFAAADVDPRDRIEVWGTRIGRGLALVAFILLAVWLLNFLGN